MTVCASVGQLRPWISSILVHGFVECNRPQTDLLSEMLVSSLPVFSGVRVTRSFLFCVMFCRSLFFLFVLFLLAIVLSVLLRFTDSNYNFSIFKLFLKMAFNTRDIMHL